MGLREKNEKLRKYLFLEIGNSGNSDNSGTSCNSGNSWDLEKKMKKLKIFISGNGL